eukprot:scaffold86134_cov20-Tisochrysis_lutea.AAC.1
MLTPQPARQQLLPCKAGRGGRPPNSLVSCRQIKKQTGCRHVGLTASKATTTRIQSHGSVHQYEFCNMASVGEKKRNIDGPLD